MPSCTDLIDVNPFYDLVAFQDIPENYTPGKDIFVIYHLGETFRPTTKDWVGLYRLGYADIRQYLALQWAPKKPKNSNAKYVRSVFFLGKDLHDVPNTSDALFQFLYISKGREIVGASRRFTICSDPQPQLQCVDRPLGSFGSMTFVELVKSSSQLASCSEPQLDGFEFLDEETQPLLAEEPRWEVVPAQDGEEDDWLTPISTRKLNKEADMTITVSDDVYDQMKLVLSQLQAHFSPMERPLPRPARAKCAQCLKRKAQINELQNKSQKLNEECEEMQVKLAESSDMVEMKEWLVTALADQVKNLVAENTTLNVMKEKLQDQAQKDAKKCKKCSKMWSKLTALQTENQKLKQDLLAVTQELQSLQAKKESDNEERLRAKCLELEQDLRKLTETMPGNCATWEVAHVGKRSRVKAAEKTAELTANLNEKIRELEINVENMTEDVQEAQAQLTQKDDDMVTILKRRDELILENEELAQRIDQLEHGLSCEQRKRSDQVRKHRDMEFDLNERISSLSAALEDAHLSKSSSKVESVGSQSMTTETSHTSCQTQVSDEPDEVLMNEFSFSNFLSRGMESLSKQFEEFEESARPLIVPVEDEPIREFIPTPLFDFYPTSLPEPETDTWTRGLFSSPASSTRNGIEVDDISLGNACNKQKIVFDFRNEDTTKDVVDASDVAQKVKKLKKSQEEAVDLRPVWQWLTPEQEEPEEPKMPPTATRFGKSRKVGDKFRVRSSPKARVRLSKPKRTVKGKASVPTMMPRPTTSRKGEDTSVICPYCDHVFKESASLASISRHIENHTQ